MTQVSAQSLSPPPADKQYKSNKNSQFMARYKRNVSTTLVNESVCCFFLLLTLNAPTSVCISSILLSIYIYIHPKAMTRRIFLVCDHFLYSHDLNVWFSGDTVGRNTFDLETWGGGGESGVLLYNYYDHYPPFILCWRRLIPRPFFPKTMWFPRKSSYLKILRFVETNC